MTNLQIYPRWEIREIFFWIWYYFTAPSYLSVTHHKKYCCVIPRRQTLFLYFRVKHPCQQKKNHPSPQQSLYIYSLRIRRLGISNIYVGLRRSIAFSSFLAYFIGCSLTPYRLPNSLTHSRHFIPPTPRRDLDSATTILYILLLYCAALTRIHANDPPTTAGTHTVSVPGRVFPTPSQPVSCAYWGYDDRRHHAANLYCYLKITKVFPRLNGVSTGFKPPSWLSDKSRSPTISYATHTHTHTHTNTRQKVTGIMSNQ